MAEFTNRQRTLLGALYPLIAVLVVNQLLDLAISITPMDFGAMTWKYGAAGFLIGAMPMVAMGTMLALALNALLDHKLSARLLGIWAIVFAVIIGLAVLSFGLDALQVRRLVREDQKPAFDDASFKSIVIAALYVPAMLWTGWAALRFSKGAMAKRDDGGPPIMVGN
ncbi:MAG TPA: hypothetical protein VFN22_07420 [Gemmatimonadales bacterium]|nr:hypothetical protein [Gemmatimonadales bacterium]